MATMTNGVKVVTLNGENAAEKVNIVTEKNKMAAERVGIYIHVPFCRSKCYYCDFCSKSGSNEAMIEDYVEAACREIDAVAENIRCGGVGASVDTYEESGRGDPAPTDHVCRGGVSPPVINGLKSQKSEGDDGGVGEKKTLPVADTVYFGGGTPTLLTVEQFGRLLDAVKRNFGIAEGAEITAEANPKTADREKLAGMRRVGINRLSIGMQSTHDNELRALGRIHSFADFERIFNDAGEVGFDNVSADLMYGIPEQTRESFKESVRRLVALSPEHISSYCLTVEEGTNFYRRRDSLNLPDEDAVAEMYRDMSDILAENGYNKYEISNFAREGRESRHNLKYWQYADYIGIGPAAHSFFEGVRSSHSRDIEAYIKGEDITDGSDIIEGDEAMCEYVMLAMRLARGVDIVKFNEKFGIDFYAKFGREFEKFAPKYVLLDEKACRFTDEGMFVSNHILSEVLDF